MPNRSRPPPSIFMPTAKAISVTAVSVTAARIIATMPYPKMRAVRWGVASISLRPNPNWKSAAIEKPLNTPPKAALWQRTKAKMNEV